VSVRNVDEALAALAGGADVIDVKEPAHGSLGAASNSTIGAVIEAIYGRAPVTAAAGELVDLCHNKPQPLPERVTLFKIGLAGCRAMLDWAVQWRQTVAALAPRPEALKRSVAVVYADWQSADAPDPHAVLQLAIDSDCPALLIDTWDKSAGSLFDLWNIQSLAAFLDAARAREIMLVLAGSLTGENIATAAQLRPDLIAVRTAACQSGRNSAVCEERVKALRQAILRANQLSLSADGAAALR
jgi:uncharacterized protein (UPF0264 family)